MPIKRKSVFLNTVSAAQILKNGAEVDFVGAQASCNLIVAQSVPKTATIEFLENDLIAVSEVDAVTTGVAMLKSISFCPLGGAAAAPCD